MLGLDDYYDDVEYDEVTGARVEGDVNLEAFDGPLREWLAQVQFPEKIDVFMFYLSCLSVFLTVYLVFLSFCLSVFLSVFLFVRVPCLPVFFTPLTAIYTGSHTQCHQKAF